MDVRTPTDEINCHEDCAYAIARVGALDVALAKIQAELDAEIAAIKVKHEEQAKPLLGDRALEADAIEQYCIAQRAALTCGEERKFAEFPTGKVGWRLGQPKLAFERAHLPRIIAELKEKRLARLLRIKEELDVRAILKEPDKVKGIRGLRIEEAQESFWIEPVAMDLAEPAPVMEG